MAKKEPTQRTDKGYEIPVPTRKQVLADLAKAAKPIPDEMVEEARDELEYPADETDEG